MQPWYRWDGTDLLVSVNLQPRSREDRIMGVHGDALKIKITSPPADGKANQHLCEYLATLCDVGKNAVKLESGDTARKKRVRLQLTEKVIPDKLATF